MLSKGEVKACERVTFLGPTAPQLSEGVISISAITVSALEGEAAARLTSKTAPSGLLRRSKALSVSSQ
jgi:hypothetical protein